MDTNNNSNRSIFNLNEIRMSSIDRGKSFLKLPSKTEKLKHTFFFDEDSVDKSTYKSPLTAGLVRIIKALTSDQVYKVCTRMNINPPSLKSLRAFVESVSPTNTQLISMLKVAFRESIMPNKNEASTVSTDESEFIDCRYSPTIEGSSVLQKISLGEKFVDHSFEMPDVPIDTHIVLQCYLESDEHTILWPNSLKILLGEIPIKSFGKFCNFSLIDLSRYGRGTVRVICSDEPENFILYVKLATFSTYSQILNYIVSNCILTETIDPANRICVLDPISDRIMKYPGKGRYCDHFECFDLKKYIIKANTTMIWKCPICNKVTPLRDLMFSTKVKEVISTVSHDNDVSANEEFNEKDDYSVFDDDLFNDTLFLFE